MAKRNGVEQSVERIMRRALMLNRFYKDPSSYDIL